MLKFYNKLKSIMSPIMLMLTDVEFEIAFISNDNYLTGMGQ